MTGRDSRCARTAIGQIAAVPPTNVMNSRRRMYLSSYLFNQSGRRGVSALGQKQTCAAQNGMSALPPIATEKAYAGALVQPVGFEIRKTLDPDRRQRRTKSTLIVGNAWRRCRVGFGKLKDEVPLRHFALHQRPSHLRECATIDRRRTPLFGSVYEATRWQKQKLDFV